MTDNSSGKMRAGAVLLGLCLTVVAAAAVIVALALWAGRQEPPASRREESAGVVSRVVLAAPRQEQVEPPPAQATEETAAPETYDYDYGEILAREDGLLVARIQGKRWLGTIAVVDDPQRVSVGTCGGFGGVGRRLDVIADSADAILAVNGGGFQDDNGLGNGGTPIGNVVQNGVAIYRGGRTDTVGLDGEGLLRVGVYSTAECDEWGMRWALSYGPALVMDGVIAYDSFRNEIQEPRTAVGQREDGSILLVQIQGRQISGLGVTLAELAELMVEYGAVNASNLDGGASSNMYFRGEYVNIANSGGGPRPIPTCLLVGAGEGGAS